MTGLLSPIQLGVSLLRPRKGQDTSEERTPGPAWRWFGVFRVVRPLLLAGLPSAAGTIVIGAPGNPFDGDCAPFGCAVEYQQVYGAGLFPGAITITGLTFFNDNFVPGSIADAEYTISLSSTTAAVDGLDATFANNLGSDNALFFSGGLGGPISPTNEFTISGTAFSYDPANGNLLLSIMSDGGGLDFSRVPEFRVERSGRNPQASL